MATASVTPLRFLLYSRDPGSTNQLVAARAAILDWPPTWSPALSFLATLFSSLNDDPVETYIIANAYAHDVWERSGTTERHDWEKLRSPDASLVDVQTVFSDILETQKITGVITGVEDIDEFDVRTLWLAARARDIPVVILFDAVHSPEVRLKGIGGVVFIPDLVVVPDNNIKNVLCHQGVPESHICVARPGYLDYLSHTQCEDAEMVATLRQKWRNSETQYIVLFASENTTEMTNMGREGRYSEHRVLTGLLEHLQSGYGLGDQAPDTKHIRVVIRPHPRDPADKYSPYLNLKGIDVIISADGSPTQAAQAADMVVGMDSALLEEAALMGKPSYSLVSHAEFSKRPGGFLDLEKHT